MLKKGSPTWYPPDEAHDRTWNSRNVRGVMNAMISGRQIPPSLANVWPKSSQVRPSSPQIGPSWAKCGQNMDNVGRVWHPAPRDHCRHAPAGIFRVLSSVPALTGGQQCGEPFSNNSFATPAVRCGSIFPACWTNYQRPGLVGVPGTVRHLMGLI